MLLSCYRMRKHNSFLIMHMFKWYAQAGGWIQNDNVTTEEILLTQSPLSQIPLLAYVWQTQSACLLPYWLLLCHLMHIAANNLETTMCSYCLWFDSRFYRECCVQFLYVHGWMPFGLKGFLFCRIMLLKFRFCVNFMHCVFPAPWNLKRRV
jgi:hypothetical protein